MQIELKVSKHPSGRLSLTERTQMEMISNEGSGKLRSNLDAGSFYRAVAKRLNELHQEGHVVTYSDTAS